MLFHYHVTHEVRAHMNFTLQMKDLGFGTSLKQNSCLCHRKDKRNN